MDINEAARVFTDPKAYADEKRFHAACAQLRRESPVTRIEVEGFEPFWAVTKHRDVMEIARQPDRWLNAPRPALAPKPGWKRARSTPSCCPGSNGSSLPDSRRTWRRCSWAGRSICRFGTS